MKNPLQRALKSGAHRLLPPRLLKYQIAWRNWRRGEAEIRHLQDFVPSDKTAIDIGGYYGAYTYFLSRIAPLVHVFEPQASCAEFLNKAYDSSVIIHPCALSDHDGNATMNVMAGAVPTQGASLASGEKTTAQAAVDGPTVQVEVSRLDAFDIDNVGFIKIDAEGEESRILAGASELLQRDKPTLLIEIEQRHRLDSIEHIFNDIFSLGYRGQFLLHNAWQDIGSFSLEELQTARLSGDKSKPYINNFLFRPT